LGIFLTNFETELDIMSLTTLPTLQIQKASHSKIAQVDFKNLVFGTTFTDHMFECDFVNGEWKNAVIKPYGPLLMDPSAKVFHYGQAVFEGMKAYKDKDGGVFMFRPEENWARINKSSERLAMPAFPKELFFEAMNTLLKMDQDWIPTQYGSALYIRPFVIATENCVSAAPSNAYKFLIILSPVNAYYSGKLKVMIAEKYSRAADGGVGFAKAAGNYAAQFYPTNLAKEKGYQQVIWTDANTHQYLEEAGTMNIFFRINDTLVTAPTNDRILDGVTRKSLIQLAESMGIDVQVRKVTVGEVIEAAKKGELLEVFGSGTAAVISPVSAVSYQGEEYGLPELENAYATQLKAKMLDIQYNISEDPFGWRYAVN